MSYLVSGISQNEFLKVFGQSDVLNDVENFHLIKSVASIGVDGDDDDSDGGGHTSPGREH